MADSGSAEKKGRFEPKNPVQLNPPKDDPISLDYLAKCDGAFISTKLGRMLG
jgi:membrane-associated progesterone receptor component